MRVVVVWRAQRSVDLGTPFQRSQESVCGTVPTGVRCWLKGPLLRLLPGPAKWPIRAAGHEERRREDPGWERGVARLAGLDPWAEQAQG